MHEPGHYYTTGRPSCTAIVCAFNEEKTLGGVLNALLQSYLVDEVVVVDDGSTDETPAVLCRFANRQKVHPILLPENRGKGYAMAEGTLNAQGEILLFVDADLLNLSPDHVAQILRPLLTEEADMIIGYPIRGQNLMEMVDPFRQLSGERALFRQDLLPLVEPIRASGYGVETLINLYYRREGKHVRNICLHGLIHPIKAEKVSPPEALGMYTHAGFQIAQATARHYPLVMAAFGVDLERVQQGWNQVGNQLCAERLTLWVGQVPHSAKHTVLRWGESPRRGVTRLRQWGGRLRTTQTTQRKEG